MPKQHNALYGDDLHNPKGITVDSHASSSKFVISASNMTITASGFTVKATAFQGDGSGLTGVPANDWDGTHSGNGVITGNLEVQGNSSGSITSTGSWGKVEATKFSGDGSGITGITGEWDGSHTGTATFTGNVTASGVVSASGGFVGDGSNLTGVTAEWDGSHTGTAAFTGNVTASGVVSASGGFVGDGSNLTGLTGGIFVETGSIQAYTGDVHITGSVKIGDPGSSTVNDAGDHIVNYSTYKFFEPQLPSGDGDYTHTLSTGDRQSSAIAWEGYSGVSVTDNNGWNGTTNGGTYGFRARNDGTQVGNYAILDMGASYYISEIKMHEKGNGSSGGVNNGNWKWQGSNDNSNWTDIGPAQNVTSSYANQTGITTAITSPGTYRYYKWIATVVGTAYQSAPVSFFELDFKIKGSDPVMTRVLEVGDGGTVSGSSTSTGSFGRLEGDGSGIAGVTDTAALPKAGGAMTGAITTNSTFDGVDIATRDAILTSTTTTADAALPKAGGTMTGALIGTTATFTGDITAQNYIVSSSVTYMTTSFSSGSTIFGDTADDTHKFIGSITASGVVSASGGFVGDGSNLTGVSSFAGAAGTETLFSGSAASTGSFGKLVFDGNALSAGWTADVPLSDISLVGIASDTATVMSGLQENDILIFAMGVSSGDIGASNSTLTSAGWTHLLGSSYSTYIYLRVYYKKVTSSVDTSFPLISTGYGKQIIMAFRSVEPDTIFDVTSTTSAGNYSTYPDPPSITTANDNSIVIAVGTTREQDITGGPSGYSNYTKVKPANTSATAMAWKKIDSAGAENPGAFTAIAGNSAAATIALRRAPATTQTTYYDLSTLGQALSGGISGSSVSTGSFGLLQGDGSGLTNLDLSSVNGFDYTSGSSPVVTTNPSSVGSTWINSTSGEIFVATDITSNENVWQGTAGNTVEPGPEFLGSRGIFGGGTSSDVIDYITISTPGNATDFGNLTAARYDLAACSNGSRGIFGGGWVSAISNIIDYITIATTGNATDFGNLTVSRLGLAASSNELRGIFGGGENPTTDTIDYITIATTGNAIDFGNLTSARRYPAGCSNGVRGLFGGGNGSGGNVDTIDYVTISTTGNATDFGDLTSTVYNQGATSNDTRGLFAGGYTTATDNKIDYVTIATTGNAADFGDLTQARRYLGACSDGTKAVFGGGVSTTNIMDYVTIATLANAADFGDLTVARGQLAGCSGT